MVVLGTSNAYTCGISFVTVVGTCCVETDVKPFPTEDTIVWSTVVATVLKAVVVVRL